MQCPKCSFTFSDDYLGIYCVDCGEFLPEVKLPEVVYLENSQFDFDFSINFPLNGFYGLEIENNFKSGSFTLKTSDENKSKTTYTQKIIIRHESSFYQKEVTFTFKVKKDYFTSPKEFSFKRKIYFSQIPNIRAEIDSNSFDYSQNGSTLKLYKSLGNLFKLKLKLENVSVIKIDNTFLAFKNGNNAFYQITKAFSEKAFLFENEEIEIAAVLDVNPNSNIDSLKLYYFVNQNIQYDILDYKSAIFNLKITQLPFPKYLFSFTRFTKNGLTFFVENDQDIEPRYPKGLFNEKEKNKVEVYVDQLLKKKINYLIPKGIKRKRLFNIFLLKQDNIYQYDFFLTVQITCENKEYLKYIEIIECRDDLKKIKENKIRDREFNLMEYAVKEKSFIIQNDFPGFYLEFNFPTEPIYPTNNNDHIKYELSIKHRIPFSNDLTEDNSQKFDLIVDLYNPEEYNSYLVIDLGTTNTAVAGEQIINGELVNNNEPQIYEINNNIEATGGNSLLPSILAYNHKNEPEYPIERFSTGEIIENFKIKLLNSFQEMPDPKDKSVIKYLNYLTDFILVIIERTQLLLEDNRIINTIFNKFNITIPAGIPEELIEHIKNNLIVKVPRVVGNNSKNQQFVIQMDVIEPVASLYSILNSKLEYLKEYKNFIIIDVGGGTTDVVSAKYENKKFEITRIGGSAFLGGSTYDYWILNYFLSENDNDKNKEMNFNEVFNKTTELVLTDSWNNYKFRKVKENFEFNRGEANYGCIFQKALNNYINGSNNYEKFESEFSNKLKEFNNSTEFTKSTFAIGNYINIFYNEFYSKIYERFSLIVTDIIKIYTPNNSNEINDQLKIGLILSGNASKLKLFKEIINIICESLTKDDLKLELMDNQGVDLKLSVVEGAYFLSGFMPLVVAPKIPNYEIKFILPLNQSIIIYPQHFYNHDDIVKVFNVSSLRIIQNSLTLNLTFKKGIDVNNKTFTINRSNSSNLTHIAFVLLKSGTLVVYGLDLNGSTTANRNNNLKTELQKLSPGLTIQTSNIEWV